MQEMQSCTSAALRENYVPRDTQAKEHTVLAEEGLAQENPRARQKDERVPKLWRFQWHGEKVRSTQDSARQIQVGQKERGHHQRACGIICCSQRIQ